MTHKFTSKFGALVKPTSVRVRLMAAADQTTTEVWVDDFRVVRLASVESCGRIAVASSGVGSAAGFSPPEFVRFPKIEGTPTDALMPNWHVDFTDFPTTEMSLSFWAKSMGYFMPGSPQHIYGSAIDIKGSGLSTLLWFYILFDDVRVNIRGRTHSISNTWQQSPLTEPVWQHYTITYNAAASGCSGRVVFYLDGVERYRTCSSMGNLVPNARMLINGRWSRNWDFNNLDADDFYYDENGMSLADIVIFSKELPATDVAKIASGPFVSHPDSYAVFNGAGIQADGANIFQSWNDTKRGLEIKATLGTSYLADKLSLNHPKEGTLPEPPRPSAGGVAKDDRYSRSILFSRSNGGTLGYAFCYNWNQVMW
jgi:hypothetical protein